MAARRGYMSRSALISRHITAAIADVRRARTKADDVADFGLDEDLCQIEVELLRIQQDLFRAGGASPSPASIPGSLKLPGM